MYIFDWCQCPWDVFQKIKQDRGLRSFFWAQQKFVVLEAPPENVPEFVRQSQSKYPNDYVIIHSTVRAPGFFSNEEYPVLNYLFDLEQFNSFSMDESPKKQYYTQETQLYFTVISGRAASTEHEQKTSVITFEPATLEDMYFIYAAANASSREYVNDINNCYFMPEYDRLVNGFNKSGNFFVLKHRGQVFGFIDYALPPKQVLFKANDNFKQEYLELYKRHGLTSVMSHPLQRCYVKFRCSFSRWLRLHQDEAARKVGRLLWNEMVQRVTARYPNNNILIFNNSLPTAIDFHKQTGMILNRDVPLLEFLIIPYPDYSYPLIDSDELRMGNHMYYFIENVQESPAKKRKLKGGTHRKRTRKLSK